MNLRFTYFSILKLSNSSNNFTRVQNMQCGNSIIPDFLLNVLSGTSMTTKINTYEHICIFYVHTAMPGYIDTYKKK